MNFDKSAFEKAFAASLLALATSENVTKEQLRIVSRTVLEAWHATGNVDYANKLVAILTPVNKKVAVLFFKHFSGFSFDDALGVFSKKSKKRYEQAHKDCVVFLQDPNNNIWSWAARNVEVEQKPFDAATITKYIGSALKKAQGAGMSQADVLKAVFKAGVSPAALIEAFNEMEFKDSEGDAVALDVPAELFGKAPAALPAAPF